MLFKSASGAGADASIEAFDDTWTWGESSKSALLDIDSGINRPLQVMMRAMHEALGDSPLMAYLAMMAVRLVELHRVLKDTGSLYLHCDPTASITLSWCWMRCLGPRISGTKSLGSALTRTMTAKPGAEWLTRSCFTQ